MFWFWQVILVSKYTHDVKACLINAHIEIFKTMCVEDKYGVGCNPCGTTHQKNGQHGFHPVPSLDEDTVGQMGQVLAH